MIHFLSEIGDWVVFCLTRMVVGCSSRLVWKGMTYLIMIKNRVGKVMKLTEVTDMMMIITRLRHSYR